MAGKNALKLDLLALGLLAMVIFLAAALLSYHPGDPPSTLVFPPHTQPTNMCGYWGALVAWLLFEGLGFGAYYLLLGLTVFDVSLLWRREVHQPWLQIGGWLMSLVGFTILAALALPGFSPGPVIGAGGYLGVVGKAVLETQFAALGSYIIAGSLLLGGLLAATDYPLLWWPLWWLAKLAYKLLWDVLRVSMAYAQRTKPLRTDLDDVRSSSSPTIRMAGRPAPQHEPADLKDAAQPSSLEQADAGPEEDAERGRAFGSRVGLCRKKSGRAAHTVEALNASDLGNVRSDYELPSLDLLLKNEEAGFEEEKEIRLKARLLEKTFLDFGFNVRVVEIQTGPVIAQFEVELEAGLRLSRITSLADDLAVALRVPSVRIVAPLPGKNTVGIEVPNQKRRIVRLREVMEEGGGTAQKMHIPLFLGKDVVGRPLIVDLTTLPHLLIAGRTGTGKSVALNSIIASILMTRRPDEVRLLLIDPKLVELSPYRNLPHLMHPVVTDMSKAEAILGWAVEKMEERYHLLARAGVRHINGYNQLGEDELFDRIQPEDDAEKEQVPTHLPYIVIVADELADLMMTSAKEVEGYIIRLAQKSRAVGIHLVLATQKPTVDVITGLIKSNLPARIAFQVASRTDSRVVLDEMGAEKLLGSGDMLFLWPGISGLIRGQGTYLSDEEIARLIAAVATAEPQYVQELVQLKVSAAAGINKKIAGRDELYETAVDIIVHERRGSVSLLQRALGIGYGRAARLIDLMAEDGIVGPYNGSQAREVLVSVEQWEQMKNSAQPQSAGRGFTARPGYGLADDTSDELIDEEDVPFDVSDEEESESRETSSNTRNKGRAEEPPAEKPDEDCLEEAADIEQNDLTDEYAIKPRRRRSTLLDNSYWKKADTA